jgi:hypothetical protein
VIKSCIIGPTQTFHVARASVKPIQQSPEESEAMNPNDTATRNLTALINELI